MCKMWKQGGCLEYDNRSISISTPLNLQAIKQPGGFARNTVDMLTNVRMLKDKDVEVYFEKEKIYTLDSKGELLITIMSSLTQEES